MRDVPVFAVGAASALLVADIARELGAQRTLADVLAWARANRAEVREIVTQDEYTHDVVMSWGERYLVFDTT
jgi:hypothetical protein